MKANKLIQNAAVLIMGAMLLTACSNNNSSDPVTPATYTIGGTVSGLSGTVVLQNNSGDDLPVTTNGQFTFNTALTDGLAYQVSVLTQPNGQTCTASSNSGTVAGSNITDVSVVCSVNTHTVGGTISGLNGTVVLQNNGGDDLTLTANGAFTFNTPVADGAGYSITVKTHPAGQLCTPSGNTGSVSGADVTSVSVTCVTAYTIGGSISGLTGTVVLRNNGGDDLARSANGVFTFNTPLLDGADYDVTVKTQPAGQTCTLSGNNGKVSGANVASVSVACQNIYNITVSSSSVEGGSVAGGGAYVAGAQVTVVATPADAYTFVNWTEGGTPVSASASYVFTADAHRTLIANFAIKTYAMTVAAGANGNIVGPTTLTVDHGASASFSVTTSTGYYPVSTVTGTCPAGAWSGNSYTTGAIAADCTVNVSFANTYTVTATGGPNGTISPDSRTVEYGTTASFAVTPDSGYGWSISGNCPSGTKSGSTYTTGAVNANCAITANFFPVYIIGGSVTGLISGTTLVLQNNEVYIKTISANGPFTFVTTLTSGSSYNVTVKTQPAGQACTILSGSGVVGTTNVTDVAVTCQSAVEALYPNNGANWNDYVTNNGTTPYNALDNACLGTETGGYNACIHGGERRVYRVAGYASCAGLTATDALGAFGWTCDASPGYARFVSTGLKNTKRLSDLIDFAATPPAWKNNSITVMNGATTVVTSPSAQWWNNPFVVDNDGMPAPQMGSTGTIYLVTASAQGSYEFGADKVALVIKPGVTLRGPGTSSTVVSVSRNFVWVEGTVNAAGDETGVVLGGVRFSVLRSVRASKASGSGVVLSGSSNNRLSSVMAVNNAYNGISISYSTNNFLSEVTATNNNLGVMVGGDSFNNTLFAVTANNNQYTGVSVGAANNALSGVTATNNGQHGVMLYTSNNIVVGVAAANNGNTGLYIESGSGNTVSGLSAANNPGGVALYSSSYNTFTGHLKVGTNGTTNCSVIVGTLPGLVDGTCANNGTSNATLTTGITLASAFAGKVTADDTINASDSSGTASYPADPATFDWVRFTNTFRGWGNDGLAFPDSGNRDRWTTGTGRIWDWSAKSTDTVNRGVLSVPTGNNTLTHAWSDGTSTTFLRNAVELTGDGDGLCESNETCLYTPNLGAYQGHGNLVSAGAFTNGVITGVTLLKYQTNGR